MTIDVNDWLHGRLEGDDLYLAKWSRYLSLRLNEGMQIKDGEFVAHRLRSVALADAARMNISISAAANLETIARSLLKLCEAFRAEFPDGDALRVRLGLIEDPARLSRSLFTVAHDQDERVTVLASIYWERRREAREAYERCHDPEKMTGWPELYAAWYYALISERMVYLNCPASTRDGSGPAPRVKELFSEDEQVTLERLDAELEEGFADIFTAMIFHATDEAQAETHTQLLRAHAEHGRLEARILLREMRRDFRAAPWNVQSWDAELV